MKTSDKKLKYRKRLARMLLIAELQLSKQYRRELNNPALNMKPEEREHKRRVVAAADKARTYCKNFPDADLKLKFLDMLMAGNCKVLKIGDEIIAVDYYGWRNAILKVFGNSLGVWI